MRAAKEAGVKVLLDGQGGDEVFGGYAKFRYAYLASLLRSGRFFRLAREVGAMIRHGDTVTFSISGTDTATSRRARAVCSISTRRCKRL